MKRTPMLVLLLAVGAFAAMMAGNACRSGSSAVGFGSRPAEADRPLPRRFVKVAPTEDESKPLMLIFEASEGTGSGYDTALIQEGAEANPNGDRKLVAKVTRQPARKVCNFADVRLSGEQEAGETSSSVLLGLCTCREGRNEVFCVTGKKVVVQGPERWQRITTVRAMPANSAEKAPLVCLGQKPAMTIQTKPDLEKKGNLGIALVLASDNGTTQFLKGKAGVDATVVLKDPQGKEVHRETQPVDKFAFG